MTAVGLSLREMRNACDARENITYADENNEGRQHECPVVNVLYKTHGGSPDVWTYLFPLQPLALTERRRQLMEPRGTSGSDADHLCSSQIHRCAAPGPLHLRSRLTVAVEICTFSTFGYFSFENSATVCTLALSRVRPLRPLFVTSSFGHVSNVVDYEHVPRVSNVFDCSICSGITGQIFPESHQPSLQ